MLNASREIEGKLRATIFSSLREQIPGVYREDYVKVLTRANLSRMQILLVPVLVLHIYLFSVDISEMRQGYWLKPGWEGSFYKSWFILDTTILTVSTLVFILTIYFRRDTDQVFFRRHEFVVRFYTLFILLWGAAVSSLDQLRYGEITTYILVLFSVSTALVIPLRFRTLAYLLSHIVLFIGLYKLQSESYIFGAHIQNAVMLIAVAWILSQLLWVYNLRSYLDKKKIMEQAAAITRKQEAADDLLRNVLPPVIANRLLAGETMIADYHTEVSVLFADIVDFTLLTEKISAESLVDALNRLFSEFDTLAELYSLEKIKTIGDCYMIVAGAPQHRLDHVKVITTMALEMQRAAKHIIVNKKNLQIRVGIHSGSVVGGVIGTKKFTYDLWGDTVNIAARMESHGEAGRIHVSSEFISLLVTLNSDLATANAQLSELLAGKPLNVMVANNRFLIEPRGEIDIKGKGMMKTFFLSNLPV